MTTISQNTNQHKVINFLKKLVEERSNGRIIINCSLQYPLSADQLMDKLSQSQPSIALLATSQLNTQASSLNKENRRKPAGERSNFYHLIDTTLGCRLYKEMAEAGFELLGIWDNGLIPTRATRSPEVQTGSATNNSSAFLSGPGLSYNTYALVIAQKHWLALPADFRVIIHEAIYTASLYAFELAEQSDHKRFALNGEAISATIKNSAASQRLPRSIDKSCLPLKLEAPPQQVYGN